MKDESFPNY